MKHLYYCFIIYSQKRNLKSQDFKNQDFFVKLWTIEVLPRPLPIKSECSKPVALIAKSIKQKTPTFLLEFLKSVGDESLSRYIGRFVPPTTSDKIGMLQTS